MSVTEIQWLIHAGHIRLPERPRARRSLLFDLVCFFGGKWRFRHRKRLAPRNPAQSFQRQAEQGHDAQNQQGYPKVGRAGHRDTDTAKQRHVRRYTSRTFRQQDQRGAWNDPTDNLTATAQPRRGPRGPVVATRCHMAAGARVHGCASAAWQHDPALSESGSYSSWRRNQIPVSLRPRGARSSHWYMPQRPSSPRAYAE
jgi:hypothetical protein